MTLAMFGTGDFALPTFLAILDAGHEVRALVTQPDRPQGRKQVLVPSRIKLAAIERGVSVFQPENVNESESVEIVRQFGADLFVTAAYGQILSAELLGAAPLGGINLHGSILPKYRGAAPVARAIQAGEAGSGVTVIRMTPRIDAGGMIAVARTPIDPRETADDLEARLAAIGAPLVVRAIAEIQADTATVLPQSKAKVTRAPKLGKADSPIDWSRPAQAIHDHVRALNSWPLAETFWHPSEVGRSPLRVIVRETDLADGSGTPGMVLAATKDDLLVAAGTDAVRLLTVQVPGKRPMSAREFLNGNRVLVGDVFGDQVLPPK